MSFWDVVSNVVAPGAGTAARAVASARRPSRPGNLAGAQAALAQALASQSPGGAQLLAPGLYRVAGDDQIGADWMRQYAEADAALSGVALMGAAPTPDEIAQLDLAGLAAAREQIYAAAPGMALGEPDVLLRLCNERENALNPPVFGRPAAVVPVSAPTSTPRTGTRMPFVPIEIDVTPVDVTPPPAYSPPPPRYPAAQDDGGSLFKAPGDAAPADDGSSVAWKQGQKKAPKIVPISTPKQLPAPKQLLAPRPQITKLSPRPMVGPARKPATPYKMRGDVMENDWNQRFADASAQLSGLLGAGDAMADAWQTQMTEANAGLQGVDLLGARGGTWFAQSERHGRWPLQPNTFEGKVGRGRRPTVAWHPGVNQGKKVGRHSYYWSGRTPRGGAVVSVAAPGTPRRRAQSGAAAGPALSPFNAYEHPRGPISAEAAADLAAANLVERGDLSPEFVPAFVASFVADTKGQKPHSSTPAETVVEIESPILSATVDGDDAGVLEGMTAATYAAACDPSKGLSEMGSGGGVWRHLSKDARRVEHKYGHQKWHSGERDHHIPGGGKMAWYPGDVTAGKKTAHGQPYSSRGSRPAYTTVHGEAGFPDAMAPVQAAAVVCKMIAAEDERAVHVLHDLTEAAQGGSHFAISVLNVVCQTKTAAKVMGAGPSVMGYAGWTDLWKEVVKPGATRIAAALFSSKAKLATPAVASKVVAAAKVTATPVPGAGSALAKSIQGATAKAPAAAKPAAKPAAKKPAAKSAVKGDAGSPFDLA